MDLAQQIRAMAEWLEEQGTYLRGWEREEGRNFGAKAYAEKAAELRTLADRVQGKVLVDVEYERLHGMRERPTRFAARIHPNKRSGYVGNGETHVLALADLQKKLEG